MLIQLIDRSFARSGFTLMLARATGLTGLLVGIGLWGLHMGMTQGLLATMVADTAPDDLRGTAYGFFNLVSGLAMLVASVLAGLLWETVGSAATFYAGAALCAAALVLLGVHRFHAAAPAATPRPD